MRSCTGSIKNNKIRTQMGRLLKPLIQRPGIEEFTAYEVGQKEQGHKVTKSEAQEIDFAPAEPEEVELPDTDEPVEAVLRVYSPVYDIHAPTLALLVG